MSYLRKFKKEILSSPNMRNYIFIDIRSSNSFNGWQLNHEPLKGHIIGALNFDITWIKFSNDLLFKFLRENNINSASNIVICHSNKVNATKIHNILYNHNYTNLYYLDMRHLKSQFSNTLEFYENYKFLIPPEYIYKIKKNKKNKKNKTKVKIFHVGFGEENLTTPKGHIKNSIYIDTNELEPPPTWQLGNDTLLLKILSKYSLTSSKTIVITSWNQMASFRIATIFMYMGMKDVRVLNGGLSSLEESSYRFEKLSNTIKNNYTISKNTLRKNKDLIISTLELKELLKKDNFTLIDNRTWLEHIGQTSGYSYYSKKARIPKSVYGYAGFEGSQSLDYYRNPDNTMKSKDIILSLWKSSNINIYNKLAFMCGSGWRASEVFFYAHVIGIKDICIYSDGFIGWSRDELNETVKGLPT